MSDASLEQNIPNPFNHTTRIYYELNKPGNLTLQIYDLTGKLVASQAEGKISMGKHFIVVENTFGAGVYFYTLTANDTSVTRKMVVTDKVSD